MFALTPHLQAARGKDAPKKQNFELERNLTWGEPGEGELTVIVERFKALRKQHLQSQHTDGGNQLIESQPKSDREMESQPKSDREMESEPSSEAPARLLTTSSSPIIAAQVSSKLAQPVTPPLTSQAVAPSGAPIEDSDMADLDETTPAPGSTGQD